MYSTSEIADDLRELPCLSSLKDNELAVIRERAYIKKYSKNDTLFVESDPVHYIFIVKTGQIKLFKTSADGRELLIKTMGPNEYFCCAPVYLNGTYSVSAVALEDSSLVVIPSEHFKMMLSGNVSDMGMKIISGLCARIKYLSDLIENLTFKDVEHRIIMSLLHLAEEKSPADNEVCLTVTHQDLASMVGSVRVVVSRTMSKLKKEKMIIESTRNSFTVDKERLSLHISNFKNL